MQHLTRHQQLSLGFLLFAALVSIALSSCRRVSTGDDAAAEERRKLATALGRNVIVPTYEEFVEKAEALNSAAREWADALRSQPSETGVAPETVREAWREAMTVWQRAEVMQVGPAAPKGTRVGGRGLRDEIYSWPTTNSCRVDQNIVSGDFAQANFFNTQLVNSYGLDALEYLVFNESTGNTCQPRIPINEQGTWNALGAAEVWQRRADYVVAASAHLVTTAKSLVTAWTDPENGFLKQFENAGRPGSDYATAAAAVDDVFAAMFYVDLVVKDVKLALPTGIDRSCKDVCPDQLESQWARHSGENVRANLEGLQRLFHGGEADGDDFGFDDLLVGMNAGDFARSFEDSLAAAIAAVHELGSMDDALAADVESVRAIHAAVKAVTDEMKTRFVTVLNLQVPQEGAADND